MGLGQKTAGPRSAAHRAESLSAKGEWPLQGPGASESSAPALFRRTGEIFVLQMAPRTALRCAPRPSASPRAAQVLLAALSEGEAVYRAFDGRLKLLRPGEILVLESELPVDVRIGDGGRLSALVAPAHLLAPRFVARERLRGGALRAHGGGVAALLHQLLTGLADPSRAGLGAGALVDAVGGLISAVLEDCWAQEQDDGQAMRKLRLEQINQHIRRHFADPELSPGDVAEALSLSRRYVHKLYAQEGRSFRQDLIALRIEACLRAFTDEQQAGKTIADIAYAAGYTDISQFNRHFRKLKGDTPSNVRRALVSSLGRKGVRRAPARSGVTTARR